MSEPAEPRAVLFACNWNTVRSPMAAALLQRLGQGRMRVESCGLQAGEAVDPFASAVMDEVGLDVAQHQPKTFDDLGGAQFDLVISLTPQAQSRAEALAQASGAALECWPCADPTGEDGSREQRLEAYRQVRRDLERRLTTRFDDSSGA